MSAGKIALPAASDSLGYVLILRHTACASFVILGSANAVWRLEPRKTSPNYACLQHHCPHGKIAEFLSHFPKMTSERCGPGTSGPIRSASARRSPTRGTASRHI